MHAIMMAPDPPSFDLSTPPKANDQDAGNTQMEIKEPTYVIQASRNKINADPSSRSITLVAHKYEKRNVRVGELAKSPFVNLETKKNYNVSKSVGTPYRMVC
jgi:hypothetical protein